MQFLEERRWGVIIEKRPYFVITVSFDWRADSRWWRLIDIKEQSVMKARLMMKTLPIKDLNSTNVYSAANLSIENQQFAGSGGISQNNREEGFLSAFQDTATGRVYQSCFSNGNPAPIHLLDGLPDEIVVRRDTNGRVTAVKSTVVAGFIRFNRFYTREQAVQFMSKYH